MSLVRLNVERWHISEDQKKVLAQFWPVLSTEEKYPDLKELLIDIGDIPEEVYEMSCISIRPLKVVRFVQRPPTMNVMNPDSRELVKEFVTTVNQITMPGFELLRYAAIVVKTNCCTEEIQSDLDEGWRIIAVLPQPGNRRPDYILVRESKP